MIDARRLLEFESRFYRHPGAKERDIRAEFGVSATVYYQALVRVVRVPPADVAVEFAPLLNRLRRRLAARVA